MAFYGNNYVRKIVIPDSVTKIGEYAFENCDNLTYNEYNGGNYIGTATNPYYYFDSIADLSAESLTLHADTVLVGSYGFEDAKNIKTIVVGEKYRPL